ncbi:metallophosphoesterase [Mangrovibacterium marinum]|uniref:5'-nucleotidase n=1 Tax=Mangrovibacterium marinum TaxID=1639118 RepID=A0A2T5C5F7_9BACT|nr:metallophosphoesterase [Mangrovibacterium marinum]PTN10098.1 5'-nucleotidase [Mangrovibacterium marinum]
MSSRRRFLKQLAAATAGAGILSIPQQVLAHKGLKKLTILHTNDIHSHIDPFSPSNPSYAGKGGLARMSGLIQQIRQQEENVLLLDSGDMFQGTPYFNYYKGELILKVMSEMGYEGSTLGNHEFDNGLDALNNALDHAKFPFINSNYDFSQTKLYDRFNRYVVYRKNGIKIGVYGLGIELQGLVSNSNYEGTIYNDPVEVAREMEGFLKLNKQCDLVICLSHLGYRYESNKISDVRLAAETRYTDLILGGHTHSFLDKPVQVKNADGNPVIINQAGWGGMVLGRLDFYFDAAAKQAPLAYYEAIPNQA